MIATVAYESIVIAIVLTIVSQMERKIRSYER